MIHVTSVHNDIGESQAHIRSHTLTPNPGVKLIITIEWSKQNILSIIEDHLLETVSATEWTDMWSDADFTFLTEHYNRFIRNIDTVDLDWISVIIALLQKDLLTISAIGHATAYLVEWDEVTQITAPEKGRYDFHALTSGEVGRDATIYLSTQDVGQLLGNELLSEFSQLDSEEFATVTTAVLKREIEIPVHITRIWYWQVKVRNKDTRGVSSQSEILRERGAAVAKYIKELRIWKQLGGKVNDLTSMDSQKKKYIFLAIGTVLLWFLIFFIAKGFSGVFTGGNDEIKEKVIEAQTLIEEAQKLTGNPEAFEASIRQANEILFSLRKEEQYLKDTQELENRIEALKKEVYDIETVDLSRYSPLVNLTEVNIDPVMVLEINNQFTIVGKRSIISGYARDNTIPDPIPYPQDDNAIDAHVAENGTVYVLTSTHRVLSPRQNDISLIRNAGQNGWDAGKRIRTFNSNIYLLNEWGNNIYRYRPGVNGFSQKADIFENSSDSTILDMAIDGGFYLLTTDGKIKRYVSTTNLGIVSLDLNKIPGAWSIDETAHSQIIASEKLAYVYILNGNRVWVFEPNSRRFQDISALTYIAQLDIQSAEDIRSINIQRDGTIYMTTENNIYEVHFEVSNGKLILK